MKSVSKLSGLFLIILSINCVYSCKKDKPEPPSITTTSITAISYTTAVSGGNVTDEGTSPLVSMGICWSTSPGATIEDSKTTQNGAMGSFVSNIDQLSQNTKYYVRAYATSSVGTGYGNEVSFTTNAVRTPLLATGEITSITGFSAISGGNISSENGGSVTERGVCWSTIANPTISNTKTSDGTGVGSFISNINGLSDGTLYHIRAYATNSAGTAYGEDLSFTTLMIPIAVADVDGNGYHAVTIGTQSWLIENLKTTKYNDGSSIPLVTNSTDWNSLTSDAYCWYDNDSNNKDNYGALYNWMVVDQPTNGNKNVCPSGWHVPAKAEWTTLFDYLTLNGYGYGGSGDLIAKSIASTWGWDNDLNPGNIGNNQNTNNSSGFTGLPAGFRRDGNSFSGKGHETGWWGVPDDYSLGYAFWYSTIGSSSNKVFRGNSMRTTGVSVRCVKD